MQLFFDEGITSTGVQTLNEQESAHAIRVLRLKENDIIDITNGKGFLYKAKIIAMTKKNCSLEIIEEKFIDREKNYKLHIAIAPTKNMDRFEWFVEKAVETGIDQITPLITRYSERKKFNPERVERIIVSAMKQSLKVHKPILNELTDYSDFIKQEFPGNKYVAYCKATDNFSGYSLKDDNLFIVGPEGGFAEFEVEEAKKHNFELIKINEFRLRTETAGVYIAVAHNLLSQNC